MYVTIALAVIKLIVLVVTNLYEVNGQKRKKKEELARELKEAIKAHDVSRINRVAESIRRMRGI